jgi:hypothetical protein
MTKPSDPLISFPDAELAKTHRQLRFVRALFEIDDPELERALAVIMDRLAKANALPDDPFPMAENPLPKSPAESPAKSPAKSPLKSTAKAPRE